MADETVGRLVGGQYQVTAFVRAGTFGQLYDATTLGGTKIALKLLNPAMFGNSEAVARFNREVRVMASFVHPGAPRVIDHGTDEDGYPWVVTEQFDGTLLAEVMADGPLPADRVQYLAVEIALVLTAAHAHGIIHRDLAPTNILLAQVGSQSDLVKVLDFGMAQMSDPGEEDEVTAAGVHIGSVQYMAPEYIANDLLDSRADLYSLGALMYEMLTGRPPFTGSKLEVLQAHVHAAPDPPSSRVAGIPAWMDALVLQLLAKDRADRPANARTVANKLIMGG